MLFVFGWSAHCYKTVQNVGKIWNIGNHCLLRSARFFSQRPSSMMSHVLLLAQKTRQFSDFWRAVPAKQRIASIKSHFIMKIQISFDSIPFFEAKLIGYYETDLFEPEEKVDNNWCKQSLTMIKGRDPPFQATQKSWIFFHKKVSSHLMCVMHEKLLEYIRSWFDRKWPIFSRRSSNSDEPIFSLPFLFSVFSEIFDISDIIMS